jgi:ketosteroid isomerase-like protein
MSRVNVELVRRFVDATNRRDADAFVANLSPDVEWEDTLFWTQRVRTYRGRAGVREWLDEIQEPRESLHLQAEEIIDASGGRLFVEFTMTARGKESGAETEFRFWSVIWIVDGLVTRRQAFHDRAEALEAAGLHRSEEGPRGRGPCDD